MIFFINWAIVALPRSLRADKNLWEVNEIVCGYWIYLAEHFTHSPRAYEFLAAAVLSGVIMR